MKNLKLASINTNIFNIFLCVMIPIVGFTLLYEHLFNDLGSFDLRWILSLECLQLVGIIFCYSVPIAFFLTKVYEFSIDVDREGGSSRILGFIASLIILTPILLVCLALLANLTFVTLILLTFLSLLLYYRSAENKRKNTA